MYCSLYGIAFGFFFFGWILTCIWKNGFGCEGYLVCRCGRSTKKKEEQWDPIEYTEEWKTI